VRVVNVEEYHYDGECLAKAEELGHPGIVAITQKQVCIDPTIASGVAYEVQENFDKRGPKKAQIIFPLKHFLPPKVVK
jgi:hypothetical protein